MNTIHGVEITLITPTSIDELHQYYQQILYMASCWDPDRDFTDEWLEDWVGRISLIYIETFLVGMIVIDAYRKTVEIHGVYNPRLQERFSRWLQRAIKREVNRIILDGIFSLQDKNNIITKVPIDNRLARFWLSNNGFKKLVHPDGSPVIDKKRNVWKLTREDYNAIKKTAEIRSRKGSIAL